MNTRDALMMELAPRAVDEVFRAARRAYNVLYRRFDYVPRPLGRAACGASVREIDIGAALRRGRVKHPDVQVTDTSLLYRCMHRPGPNHPGAAVATWLVSATTWDLVRARDRQIVVHVRFACDWRFHEVHSASHLQQVLCETGHELPTRWRTTPGP